jgi:hypothetical protein
MRKLRLEPEALRVESFAPRDELGGAKGTVHARSYPTEHVYPTACCGPSELCQETDYDWYTCGVSCLYMCLPTGDNPNCVR